MISSEHIHRLAIAPMMEWTDRHFRYFARLITRRTMLYTEMVTTGALLHGDATRHLNYDPSEHPLALQVGGSDPAQLAYCAKLAAQWGYDEINLNLGCPSDRVSSGRFGACLMAEPDVVGNCIAAMHDASTLPVTVKTRIGIDDRDSYGELLHFVETIAAAGCRTFIIHARKAWLHGLSPKENREIPPLRHDVVHRLKQDLPHLEIIINGGIRTLAQASLQLEHVDGVMIGREAYHNPYVLAEADAKIFHDLHPVPSRHEIVEALLPYMEQQLRLGVRLNQMTRHILGLFQGLAGARAWRRHLSEHAHQRGAGIEVVRVAARCVANVDQASTDADLPIISCTDSQEQPCP